MNTLRLVFLLAFLPLCAVAQKYHTGADMYKIMEESKLAYNVGVSLDSMDIEYDTYSQRLVMAGTYVDRSGRQPELRLHSDRMFKYPELKDQYFRAEEHFTKHNYDSARAYYQMILDVLPDNSNIMTYMGQSYGIQKEFEQAKEWYTQAIEANPAEYMAHWFIADIYKREENYDLAVQHITIAHLFNRNNPRLLAALTDIYALNETPYDPWVFRPVYALHKGEAHNRDIGLDVADSLAAPWIGYAMCKALWAFEPDYADEMLAGASEPPFLIEERECLLSLATIVLGLYDQQPIPQVEFRKMIEALENKAMDTFLLYEIVLRRNPSVAALLPPAVLQSLTAYIAKYHIAEQ